MLQTDDPPPPRWLRVAVILAWIVFGVFVAWNFGPYSGGSDSSGYFSSARFLASGHLTGELRSVEEVPAAHRNVHAPIGTSLSTDGHERVIPTYPVGVPLHLAFSSLIAGWTLGPVLIGTLAAMAGAALCFGCLRRLNAPYELAAAGATALVVSPLFIFSALQPMSDALATVWVLAGFYFALGARDRPLEALACGFAFSIAVLVRPSNAILFPIFGLVLWHWRPLSLAVVGALPGALFNAFYNYSLNGHPLAFGYGNPSSLFSSGYFWPTLMNYVRWLPLLFPIIVVAALTAPLLPWRNSFRIHASLILWTLLVGIFYLVYQFTHETWWYLRFLLPAFPAIVLLAIGGLHMAVQRSNAPRRRTAIGCAAAVLALGSVLSGAYWVERFDLLSQKEGEGKYKRVSLWTATHLPANALVASMQYSGAIHFYTDRPILRWDLIGATQFAEIARNLEQSGRPLYAVLFPFEVDAEVLKTRLPGKWTKAATVEDATVWKWEGPNDPPGGS